MAPTALNPSWQGRSQLEPILVESTQSKTCSGPGRHPQNCCSQRASDGDSECRNLVSHETLAGMNTGPVPYSSTHVAGISHRSLSLFCHEAIGKTNTLPPNWQQPENILSLSRDEVYILFQLLEPEQHNGDETVQAPGRLPRSVAGSEQAEELRHRILQDAEHQDMPWIDVTRETGLDIAQSTLENVVHKVLDIYYYQARTKPRLNCSTEESRVEFATWALQKINC
ncbi:unnamed protein product [Tuber aestivum]|uniref:Uncharacterized protein n=1 Tax=Tuber aestivum TaxID=59557 RepID=A0A292PJF5_9PEZI|nr:unnamed protein product [Tuber aestivum]